MGELIKIVVTTLKEHFERQGERNKKRSDEDYDEGVEEQLVDEDDEDTYTLSKLGDLVHALFAAYKEQFLPCFEQILPFATKLLVSYFKNFYVEITELLGKWPENPRKNVKIWNRKN